MDVEYLVIGIIAFFVLLYLLYALIRPERL
jgi:K+-transporting ATPase KdpF subunit